MVRVSAGELQRQWGKIQDLALAEPVTVTCNGRDRMVILSAEEYSRLRRRVRQAMTLSDFTDADILALEKMQPSAEAASFDHEVGR